MNEVNLCVLMWKNQWKKQATTQYVQSNLTYAKEDMCTRVHKGSSKQRQWLMGAKVVGRRGSKKDWAQEQKDIHGGAPHSICIG